MNSLKAMYGCGLNFFIKLAYNSLFLYKFAHCFRGCSCLNYTNTVKVKTIQFTTGAFPLSKTGNNR